MSCVWPWWSLTGSKGGTGDNRISWKYWTSWMVQHDVVEIEWVGGWYHRAQVSLYNHPKPCTGIRDIPQDYHTFTLFDPVKILDNSITPVSRRCHINIVPVLVSRGNQNEFWTNPWLELSTASPIRCWRQRMTATTMKKRTPSLISHLSLFAKTKQGKSMGESRFCAERFSFWAFRWRIWQDGPVCFVLFMQPSQLLPNHQCCTAVDRLSRQRKNSSALRLIYKRISQLTVCICACSVWLVQKYSIYDKHVFRIQATHSSLSGYNLLYIFRWV